MTRRQSRIVRHLPEEGNVPDDLSHKSPYNLCSYAKFLRCRDATLRRTGERVYRQQDIVRVASKIEGLQAHEILMVYQLVAQHVHYVRDFGCVKNVRFRVEPKGPTQAVRSAARVNATRTRMSHLSPLAPCCT